MKTEILSNGMQRVWGRNLHQSKIGLDFTNWKKNCHSTSNSEWKLRWNLNVLNFQGMGGIIRVSGLSYSLCSMRLLRETEWMYTWGEQWILDRKGTKVIPKGTPVIIFDETNFKTKPWKDLL